MLVPLALLGAAAGVLLLSPSLLTAGRWQVRYPRTALALWFCAFFAGIGLVTASVIVVLFRGVIIGNAQSWEESVTLTVAGWLSLGIIGALIGFASASAEPLTQSWREAVNQFAPIAVAHEKREGYTLVWFRSDEPFACAVPSPASEILISTALRGILSDPQLAAVIAHEWAHLRQKHGWAVRIAEINALCLPRALTVGRDLKRATLLLVELIADDTAATQAGAANLANALAIMSRAAADPGLELRAERLTLRRWPIARRKRITRLSHA